MAKKKVVVVRTIGGAFHICIGGESLKVFASSPCMCFYAAKYLRENNLLVSNADAYDGWLDEFKASEL